VEQDDVEQDDVKVLAGEKALELGILADVDCVHDRAVRAHVVLDCEVHEVHDVLVVVAFLIMYAL